MNEFELIGRYFAPLAGEGAFGLKDDVALLPQRAGHDLVVTTDAISEGTDFFAFDPADTIAQKALRVNLSDLAAKGAEPVGYLLNLSLPHSVACGLAGGFRRRPGRRSDANSASRFWAATPAPPKARCPSPSPPSDLCPRES